MCTDHCIEGHAVERQTHFLSRLWGKQQKKTKIDMILSNQKGFRDKGESQYRQ